jgi:cell division protein FtsX
MSRRSVLTSVSIVIAVAVAAGLAWRWSSDGERTAPPSRGCALSGSGASGSTAELEIILFLDRNVTDAQRADVADALAGEPRVESFEYHDQAASEAEFRQLFEDNQAMLDRISENPELLPTSYRAVLADTARQDIATIEAELAELPGVLRAHTLDCE